MTTIGEQIAQAIEASQESLYDLNVHMAVASARADAARIAREFTPTETVDETGLREALTALADEWESGIERDDLRRVLAAHPAPTADITALVELSSFGTPAARAARQSVSDEDARRVVERSKQLAAEQAPPVTVTDDMVERAARAIRDHHAVRLGGTPIETPLWHNDLAVARAALSAALTPEEKK